MIAAKQLRVLLSGCIWLMAAVGQTMGGRMAGEMLEAPAPVTKAELQSEIDVKLRRVHDFLAREHLAGILLTRLDNFSWVTAGIGDNHIIVTSEIGTSSLLIMRDGSKYVVTNNSEMPRLLHEDLAGLGYQPREYEWYQDKIVPDRKLQIIQEIAKGQGIGTDVPYGALKMVADDFAPLRYRLTESEIKKYRWVGRAATEAVVAVCKQLKPGVSEREMEAMASNELMRRGLRPTVLLMGVDIASMITTTIRRPICGFPNTRL